MSAVVRLPGRRQWRSQDVEAARIFPRHYGRKAGHQTRGSEGPKPEFRRAALKTFEFVAIKIRPTYSDKRHPPNSRC